MESEEENLTQSSRFGLGEEMREIFFFFLISWRLIALQYCSGFCHTLT